MKDNQLDMFRERTAETTEGAIDFVAYTIQGIQYAYPKMTQSKELVLKDVEDIMYWEPPLNSAKKKAYAKMLSALNEDKQPLFNEYEIEIFVETKFSEVYHEVYYNITNESKLVKKIDIATTYLDKHNITLVPNQMNNITIRSFADKALCDGASYAKIISWIPKLKKCKDLKEYEASITEFYDKYELYYEETF